MFIPASSSSPPSSLSTIALADDRAIRSFVQQCIAKSGLSQAEVARRLGMRPQSVNQAVRGRVGRPSLHWIVRVVTACGGAVILELPGAGRGSLR